MIRFSIDLPEGVDLVAKYPGTYRYHRNRGDIFMDYKEHIEALPPYGYLKIPVEIVINPTWVGVEIPGTDVKLATRIRDTIQADILRG